MKWLLLLSVLSLSAAAQSVDPCTGQTTSAPVWTPPDLTKDVVCERATGADYGYNGDGVALWQYCWDATKGKYYPMTGVATWGYIQKNPGLVGEVLKNWPKAGAATIKRILVTYDSPGTFIDPESAAIWCPLRAKILAGIPASPVWVTTSTVLYRINETDSGLGVQVGTVPRGAVVDPAGRRVFSRMNFCQWKGGTTPFKTFVRCAEKP